MRTDVKVVSICVVLLILGAISARIWFIVASPQPAAVAPAAESDGWVKLKFHYELAVAGPAPSAFETMAIEAAKRRLKSITAQPQIHPAGPNEIEVWLPSSSQLHKILVENAPTRNYPHAAELFEILTPDMQAAQDSIAAAVSDQGGVDPADIIRLLSVGGLLEFRIAANPADLGGVDDPLYRKTIQDLKTSGPAQPVHANDATFHWSQIDPAHLDFLSKPSHDFITADWSGQTYILLYDDKNHTLLHNRKPDWSVSARNPTHFDGQLVLPFSLDPVGGSYMGDLTANNLGRPLGILLDDQLLSAPYIHSRISEQGEIMFPNDPLPEIRTLQLLLNLGVSPIRFRFVTLAP